MSVPLKNDDPAAWMLQRGIDESNGTRPDTGWVTKTNPDIYRDNCYICVDPEFALMGLPVCYACLVCGGHVPADDVECENGHTDPRYEDYDPEVD
jgi:hypothetical protein